MMTPEQKEDLEMRMHEIVANARKVLEHAEEAQHHLEQGDLKASSQVLSLSHYKVSGYDRCKEAYLEKLEKLGITPGN